LSKPATKFAPLLAGRNLYVRFEEENLAGADGVNRALCPYWPILWRLAALGHYYVKQEPIREKPKIAEEIFKPPIPPVTERGYTLSFERGEGNDSNAYVVLKTPQIANHQWNAQMDGLVSDSISGKCHPPVQILLVHNFPKVTLLVKLRYRESRCFEFLCCTNCCAAFCRHESSDHFQTRLTSVL